MLSSKPSFNRLLFPGWLILKRCSHASILPNNLIFQAIMGHNQNTKTSLKYLQCVCVSSSLLEHKLLEDNTLFNWSGSSLRSHHQTYHKSGRAIVSVKVSYIKGELLVQRYKGSLCSLSSTQDDFELIPALEVSMEPDEVIMKNVPPCKSFCPILSCPSMHVERC